MTASEKLSLGFYAETVFLESIGIVQDTLVFLLS